MGGNWTGKNHLQHTHSLIAYCIGNDFDDSSRSVAQLAGHLHCLSIFPTSFHPEQSLLYEEILFLKLC